MPGLQGHGMAMAEVSLLRGCHIWALGLLNNSLNILPRYNETRGAELRVTAGTATEQIASLLLPHHHTHPSNIVWHHCALREPFGGRTGTETDGGF